MESPPRPSVEEISGISPIKHLMVNRMAVLSDRCSACGKEFPSNVAAVRALSATFAPSDRIHVFCAVCGDSILAHVMNDAIRQRYVWDWVVPLHGAIGESPFEEESVTSETSVGSVNGQGFHAFGKTFESEREAIVSFLGKVSAGEANGGEAFSAWAEVAATDGLKTGLRMIAEREAYHARIFERRIAELGSKSTSPIGDGHRFKEFLGNPKISDAEKLRRFTVSVGNPKVAVQPIRYFAALIKEDAQTKQALLLFSEDEFSSLTWLWNSWRVQTAFLEGQSPEATARP